MGRFLTAWRVFWRVLVDGQAAGAARQLLSGAPPSPAGLPAASPPAPAPAPATPVPAQPKAPPPPLQNPAITLLATLQREARLIDFLLEDLQPYSDEQIGAAVREVHRDAAQVLQRVLAMRPLVAAAEGDAIDVAEGFDAGRFRLTGRIPASGPYRGALRHHGWEATRCDLPTYTGSAAAALVIAPAEVEIQ